MVIFLKSLYILLMIWNLTRMILYMLFSTFDDDVGPEKLETRVNLMWATLHAVIICALVGAWKVIF
jgi:hypothetical protein